MVPDMTLNWYPHDLHFPAILVYKLKNVHIATPGASDTIGPPDIFQRRLGIFQLDENLSIRETRLIMAQNPHRKRKLPKDAVKRPGRDLMSASSGKRIMKEVDKVVAERSESPKAKEKMSIS